MIMQKKPTAPECANIHEQDAGSGGVFFINKQVSYEKINTGIQKLTLTLMN